MTKAQKLEQLMRIGIVSIEMVHTGSDEHYLTAFAEDGEALMSIDTEHNITDAPMTGERIEQIQTVTLSPAPGQDLATTDPLEEALISAAEDEWPFDEDEDL